MQSSCSPVHPSIISQKTPILGLFLPLSGKNPLSSFWRRPLIRDFSLKFYTSSCCSCTLLGQCFSTMTWSEWMTPMQRVRNQVEAMHSLYSSFFLFFLSYLVAWLWLHIYLSSVWLTIDLTLSRWPGSEVDLYFSIYMYLNVFFLFLHSCYVSDNCSPG